jgi:diguanylate cyclase (GGDEF)-like protein
MCASGPFSAYRRSIVDEVKERYISQQFLGEACTFGDDRHLTNLVLDLGHGVVYDEYAVAHTHAPTTMRQYVRQQTRWNKSFYREILWTVRFAHRHHPYMLIDLLLQAVLPFLLLGALAAMAYQALFVDLRHLWFYLGMIAVIGLLRSSYGIFRTRSLGFLSFMVYGFIHVGVLIPVRLYALFTIRRGHWGTRGSSERSEEDAELFSQSAFERREFEERLTLELTERRAVGGAVLAIGLDDLDFINREHGFRAGERLMMNVADALRRRLERVPVARVASDQFAVLLPETEIEEAVVLGRELLASVRMDGLPTGETLAPVTVSIGVAPLDPTASGASECLVRAESAMHRARDIEPGTLARWAVGDWSGEEALWAPVIRQALEHRDFHLHGQPVQHLTTGRVEQWELLLRLRHRDQVVPPMAFLPTAERLGLAREIDRWVANEAIMLAVRHAANGEVLRLEVNLSATSIGDVDFLGELARWLEAAAIHPWSLVFETRESAAVHDLAATRHFAHELRGLGCRFAIDNFGSPEGNAAAGSDQCLEAVAPDYVKIDGSLIRHLPAEPGAQQRVRELVVTARRLGLQTIAEFVGDGETADLLQSFGVDYAQGFHIGKPRPLPMIGATETRRSAPDSGRAADQRIGAGARAV